MRESINIIDEYTIEVKGHIHTSSESGLVFIIRCLTKDYDNLKCEYDRLVEQQEKLKNIGLTDGNAYIMTFFDLSNRLELSRQTLMLIASRPEFDKYRTYVTKPRKRPALIVTKNSLKLLYKYLNEKSRISFSEQKFKTLLRDITNGQTC